MSSSSSCHVVFPSLEAWIHAVAIHGGLVVFAGLPIGVLLYAIVMSQHQQQQQQHHDEISAGSISSRGQQPKQERRPLAVIVVSLLVAFSILIGSIPLSKKMTTSWMSRFLLSTFCFSTFLKTLSVALGTLPHDLLVKHHSLSSSSSSSSLSSLQTWLIWFTSLPEPVLAKQGKLLKATKTDIQQRAFYLSLKITGLFFLVSLLLHVHQQQQQEQQNEKVVVVYYSFMQHRLLGLAHVWFLYCWLALCLDVSALTIMLCTGAKSYQGFCNPLLLSRSMAEAWGERWNLPVARLLQRCIYKPVRLQLGWSRSASIMATFLASGLLHEYTFVVHNGYDVYHLGMASVFFIFMGVVLLFEHAVLLWAAGGHVERFMQNVPSPVISTIVTMLTAIPFEAFFLKSWMDAGALEAVSELVPHVKCRV